MLKCTINGKEVEVKEGSTIIEAYKASGVDICHYCWHPGLSVAGVCRLCMVEIEGNPRQQIACNTLVTEGMKINNTSEKVKESVKWGLDFHLINHPLDCPICDQAGECGLQDQYMKFGKYDPEMAESKVKKRKVVDLGPTVVLDSERCILCSRCVRFTDEVSKTHELGIFNRGDRSEIGTFQDKPLDNNYSMNTVDICPVGALTSKEFRFRQRVWFLKEHETICTGCSTGCNVNVYYNREGVFRVKPILNEKINGYWMCDVGRGVYKFHNPPVRMRDASMGGEFLHPKEAAKKVGASLRAAEKGKVALVLTGQHSVEEYEEIVGFFKNAFGSDKIFHWINNPEKLEEFDGLLFRGDQNPNTKGLKEILDRNGIKTTWKDLEQGLQSGAFTTVVVVGPEKQDAFPDMGAKIQLLSKAKHLVWMTACLIPALEKQKNVTLIPLKTYIEKDGTYVNYNGIRQTVKKCASVIPYALAVDEVTGLFAGEEVEPERAEDKIGYGRVQNEYIASRGAL